MPPSSLAQLERETLCDLLVERGPDAPTLCEGWSTADLAAHLVVRERRPDSGPGLVWPPLAGYTDKVRIAARDRTPWAKLVETVRRGPPFLLRPFDGPMNTVEFFIHVEDVRRVRKTAGNPAQSPRSWPTPSGRAFGPGGMAKKVPATIVITSPGRANKERGNGPRLTLSGEPGRTDHVQRWTPRRSQSRDQRRWSARRRAARRAARCLTSDASIGVHVEPGTVGLRVEDCAPAICKNEQSEAVLLIDAANVIGSRPTGWWRDRAGAARAFVDQLRAAVDSGRVAEPAIVVLEGKARDGVQGGVADGVTVLHAAGSGDDTLIDVASNASDVVILVTADRELRRRAEALGAEVVGPGWLLELLE